MMIENPKARRVVDNLVDRLLTHEPEEQIVTLLSFLGCTEDEIVDDFHFDRRLAHRIVEGEDPEDEEDEDE